MKTKEEILEGLRSIKVFLNGRYHKGLYDQVIEESPNAEYKARAKNIDLATQTYKDDMETLEEAIKIIEEMG